MNGHTNNRILLSWLKNQYKEAKQQKLFCPGNTAYQDGVMAACVSTAIMMGLVQNLQELEE